MLVWKQFDEEKSSQFRNGANNSDDNQNIIRSMLQTIERKVEEEVV